MVSLHHFEVTTSNLSQRVSQFQNQFGFRIFGHHLTPCSEGVALCLNSVVMVIRATISVAMETPLNDWISDVVLHTSNQKDYDELHTRVKSCVDTPTETSSSTAVGATERSVLESTDIKSFRVLAPFRSVYHTVTCEECNCVKSENEERERTKLSCLPGFVWCPRLCGAEYCSTCAGRFDQSRCVNVPCDISHIDHVTFACHSNSSDSILRWYERHLGFHRFRINASEDDKNGFIIKGNNGMRMLAMQYWQCSETSVRLGEKNKPVQLVFAEPLPNSGPNQVKTFLRDNCGPGVQHIAFHTENIVGVVSCLRSNQVFFITPPPEYYSLFEKVAEIETAGEKVDLLQRNNILIDFEVEEEARSSKYLMQVFSHPLFGKDTFFLEVIQRCGATGFGAGNITALWKALEIHFRKNQSVSLSAVY